MLALPQPPAAPLPGETTTGLSTWDLASPYRPGTADFDGVQLQNANGVNGNAPPPLGDGSMPTAALLNSWSLFIIALGKMIPNVRLSLQYISSVMTVMYAQGAPSWVATSAFVVTRNGAGDYSITYAQPSGSTTWAASTAYTSGTSFVLPPIATGYYYKCTTSGTSGTSAPIFPVVVGNTVSDGGAVWTCWGTVNALPPMASDASAQLNLPAGLAGSTEYAISAVAIQNGVHVTTSENGTLTDLNFSVNIY